MRPELGAQITLSFLAHISIFMAANQFMSSSEIPRFDITINTTQITESSLTIYWKVVSSNDIDQSTETEDQNEREKEQRDYVINNISDIYITIYSLEIEDLSFKSPAFKNVTRGEYVLTNLQGKMKYNVCVIVRITNKDVGEVNRCVGVKTGRYNDSRFRLMSGLKSNPNLTSSIGGGMLVLCVVMAVGVFVGATILSYNTLLKAFRKRGEGENDDDNVGIRYHDFIGESDDEQNGGVSSGGDIFDHQIRRMQMEEPLLTATNQTGTSPQNV